jgi:hypothetical protein
VIFVDFRPDSLEAFERFGLGVLLDQSRLLQVEDPAARVVRLALVPDGRDAEDELAALAHPLRDSPGRVVVSRAQLGAIGRLAGAAAEQVSAASDRYGRVPSSANALVRGNASADAPVSRFAADLRALVARHAGSHPVRLVAPWPEGRRWAACLTSDLDLVRGWPFASLARMAELTRHGAPRQVVRTGVAAAGAIGRGPVARGINALLAALAREAMRSTWFVIAGTPGLRSWLRGDVTYRVESTPARRIVQAVIAAGHEVGLHGSFATMTDGRRLRIELDRLAEVTGREVAGVRQHFLRMRPGETQRAMVQAGLRYDATFGFADRNGFRLGTADVVPGWDARTGQESGLEEVPLVWMDRALSKYGGVEDPERWVDEALALAATCRDLGGLWVGLWHPNLTTPLGFPGAEPARDRLVASLRAERPYLATLAEIVAWRRRRRAARAATVLPDGTPVLQQDRGVTIEDANGQPVEARVQAGA